MLCPGVTEVPANTLLSSGGFSVTPPVSWTGTMVQSTGGTEVPASIKQLRMNYVCFLPEVIYYVKPLGTQELFPVQGMFTTLRC